MQTRRMRKRAEKQAEEMRKEARQAAGRIQSRASDLGQEVGTRARALRHDLGTRTKATRRQVGYWIAGERPHRHARYAVLAAGVGAAAAFFLDPVSGKRRRHVAGSWLAARFRGAGRRAERAGRAAGAQAYGTWQSVRHAGEEAWPENDAVLAHKVESEVLGGLDLPAGRINVNAENGVVVLRGEVDQPQQVRDIEERVRRVRGVRGVENLLHLPGTPAPMT